MRANLNPLDAVWESTPRIDHAQASTLLGSLPEPARRYLQHAIAPGTALAMAVRLRMHGEIKLGRWWPFRAEEVIRWDRGMIWRAVVRMYGLPVRGSDVLLDGQGRMRWRLFGLIPLLRASGRDITRSAAGRLAAESVWLPAVLAGDNVAWTALDASRARVRLLVSGETATVELTVTDGGRLRQLALTRWGNPDGGQFRSLPFGALVEDEASFRGYTIPTRLRVVAGTSAQRSSSKMESSFGSSSTTPAIASHLIEDGVRLSQ